MLNRDIRIIETFIILVHFIIRGNYWLLNFCITLKHQNIDNTTNLNYNALARQRTKQKHRGQREGEMKRVGGGVGIGTILLVGLTLLLGGDTSAIIGSLLRSGIQQTQGPTTNQPYQGSAQEEALAELLG